MLKKVVAYHFIILMTLLLLGSCKKKIKPTDAPELTFVSITPTSAVEYKDEIKIRISYKDKNGDIGENDNNVNNVIVKDNRNGVEYNYRVKQLAPSGSSVSIKGELEIVLQNTLITDNSNSQAVSYYVKLKDRAGNWSNEIITSSISITK